MNNINMFFVLVLLIVSERNAQADTNVVIVGNTVGKIIQLNEVKTKPMVDSSTLPRIKLVDAMSLIEEPQRVKTVWRPNVLKFDLSSGILGIAYERVINDFVSVQVSAQYSNLWYISLLVKKTDVTGYGGGVRAFLFPWKREKGWYASPFYRTAFISSTEDLGMKVTGLGIAGGITVGYHWDLGERVTLKLGLGAEYWHYLISDRLGDAGYAGVFAQIDILIGIRF
jgi:hypothetical protein